LGIPDHWTTIEAPAPAVTVVGETVTTSDGGGDPVVTVKLLLVANRK
jgi:hypothetical protein